MTRFISRPGFLIAISLIVWLSVASANAETTARFHVPFHFLMGDKLLPAGDYTVKIDNASRRMDLVSWKAATRLFLTANSPRRSGALAADGAIVFHRYGNVYVLRQMWKAGASTGYELPTSKVEREMARAVSRSDQSARLLIPTE